MDGVSDFYVYCYAVDGTPRYIGKGRGNRIKEHLTRARRHLETGRTGETHWQRWLMKRLRLGQTVRAAKLATGLTERQALDIERAEIARVGRLVDGTGPLLNDSEGGDGMTSPDAKRIAARRWAAKPELRKLASERMRKYWSGPNARAHLWATPDYRKQHSARQRQRWADPEKRAKQSEIQRRHWADPAKRKKQSQTVRAALKDPELRKAKSERMKAAMSDPAERLRRGRSISAAMNRRRSETFNDPRQLPLQLEASDDQ